MKVCAMEIFWDYVPEFDPDKECKHIKDCPDKDSVWCDWDCSIRHKNHNNVLED
jgi:hypothetical protein